jgi:capsular polysaccharide transport system permease protein
MDGIDLSVPEAAATAASRYHALLPRPRRPSWLRRHKRLVCFTLFVLVPTAVVATYYLGFAADQYTSEAKFVVHGQTAQSPGVLSTLLESTGMGRAEENTYAVNDYILSRDALSEMIKDQDLPAVFNRPEADSLSRFPLLQWHATFEHFFKYYLEHVDVTLDTTTGVSAITVKTYRPEDSQRIANALLGAAEALVNRMNTRQRENAMRDARKEVALAESRVADVANQIAKFRNREALLDPTKQSVPMLAGINDLQTMLSRTNLQISQLTTSTPRSPLIADMRRRAAALQGQITDARAKITGTDSSLVPKIAAFDKLELQRLFADRQLASATASLEAARMQAERQQLYLETIVQPNKSDYPAYPKAFASIAVAFATFMAIYVMASLLIAGAREHRLV